jgi:hypothetical protein
MNEPVKVRSLEIVEHWACRDNNHRHRTKVSATTCMEKSIAPPVLTQKERQLSAAFSCIECLLLFLELESFSAVAKVIGKSNVRTRQKVGRSIEVLDMYMVIGWDHKKSDYLQHKESLIAAAEKWKLKQIDLGLLTQKR